MIVTLTTDWHRHDYYVGSLKGSLLSACPDLQIVDISHSIQTFNTTEAALVLQQAFPHFPKGTLHLVGVNSEPEPGRSLVLLEAAGHYFAGPDDGMWTLLLQSIAPDRGIVLPETSSSPGFRALPAFTAALKLVMRGEIAAAGQACELKKTFAGLPGYDRQSINGQVVYIDSYGNAITNIGRELFDKAGGGRPFEIILHTPSTKITTLANYYGDAAPGELLGLFNSAGYLEFAVNKGNLAQLESIATGASVRIKFLDTINTAL